MKQTIKWHKERLRAVEDYHFRKCEELKELTQQVDNLQRAIDFRRSQIACAEENNLKEFVLEKYGRDLKKKVVIETPSTPVCTALTIECHARNGIECMNGITCNNYIEESESSKTCVWTITDKEICDHIVYSTSCGLFNILPVHGTTCRCGKNIEIKGIDNDV